MTKFESGLMLRATVENYEEIKMKKFMLVAVLAIYATPSIAGPLLGDGQSVVASFTSGKLKGKTFRLRYSEKKNMLKNRPVTKHTKSIISIKTPGGWCKFSASGKAKCHNGTGTWKAR